MARVIVELEYDPQWLDENDTDLESELGSLSSSNIGLVQMKEVRESIWLNSMIDKLADANNQIAIVWSIGDVKSTLDDHFPGVELSDEECVDILQQVEDSHDANIGVNWETLRVGIENYLSVNYLSNNK